MSEADIFHRLLMAGWYVAPGLRHDRWEVCDMDGTVYGCGSDPQTAISTAFEEWQSSHARNQPVDPGKIIRRLKL